MPCQCDPPTRSEIEHGRLKQFVNEIDGKPFDHKRPTYGSGQRSELDALTQRLCAYCQANDVSRHTLELQIWWRDHQASDARRKSVEEEEARRKELRASALSKLTAEELAALTRPQ